MKWIIFGSLLLTVFSSVLIVTVCIDRVFDGWEEETWKK